MIESEQGDQPLFIMVYTVFNHFPGGTRLRPELTPDWRALGNDPEVDEYLRRQTLSARDYADFKQRLARDFPASRSWWFASAIISPAWRGSSIRPRPRR